MIIEVNLSIGYAVANQQDEIEIDDEELEGLNEKERDKLIDEYVWEWANNYIETWWKIKK